MLVLFCFRWYSFPRRVLLFLPLMGGLAADLEAPSTEKATAPVEAGLCLEVDLFPFAIIF